MNTTSTIKNDTGFSHSIETESPARWLRNGYIEGTATGKQPRPWFPKWGWWFLPISLFALVLGGLWGVNHIQSQVVSAAPEILRKANIDPSGLQFDADYRDIQVQGALPAGVSQQQIISALENEYGRNGEDIRRAIVTATPSAAVSTAPPAPADINVTVVGSANQITLDGSVPLRRHRDLLQIAAASTVGPAQVANNIEVLNAPSAIENPQLHVKALAKAVSQLDSNTLDATLSLQNEALTGTIQTSDPSSYEMARTAIADTDITVELSAANTASNSDDPVLLLQQELDYLQNEIAENVVFDNASATLKTSSYKTLNKVVSALRDYPDADIEIGGHTDSRSSSSYNEKLSLQRARSVAEFLQKRRIDSNRLASVGYGETRPIASNETEQGRLKNRRVEIKAVTR